MSSLKPPAICRICGTCESLAIPKSATVPGSISRRVRELETLYVRGIRDAGMANLCGLTRLRTLSVTQTNVTDAGLVYLKDLTQLEELNLTATKITDAGLENLMGFAQLRILHVTATAVTDAGVKRLRTALPECKVYR